MRLISFLNESTNISMDEVISNTSQYRKEVKNDYSVLIRGTNRNIGDVEKLMPRVDRQPKDTPTEVHNKLDDLFNKKFGWKVRSVGVFVTSDVYKADNFGNNIYHFIPIDGYKYVYSPDIKDLTGYLEQEKYLIFKRVNGRETWKKNEEISDSFLSDVVYKYTNKHLMRAVNDEWELSFNCPNGYYLATGEYINELHKKLSEKGAK